MRPESDDRLDALIRRAVSTDAGPSPELDAALLASLDAPEAGACPGELGLWQVISGAAAALLTTVLLCAAVWLWIPSWPLRLAVWLILTAPAGGMMLMLAASECGARGAGETGKLRH